MDRFISSNAPNPRWLWCTPALTMNTLHRSPRSWLLQNWIQIFLSGLSDNIFNQCSAATAELGAAVAAVNSEKLISLQPPARVMNSENLRQTQTVKGFDLKTPELDRNMSESVWLKRNTLSMRDLWLKKHTQPMRDLQTEINAHRTNDEKLAGFRSNSYTGHPWQLWWEYSCGDQVVWWCLYMLSGVWSLSIETLYPHQSLRHPDQTRQRVTQTTLLLLLADDDRYQLSTLQMLKIHKNLTVITII